MNEKSFPEVNEVQPIDVTPFPEVNVATHDYHGQNCGHRWGNSHGRVNFKSPASR